MRAATIGTAQLVLLCGLSVVCGAEPKPSQPVLELRLTETPKPNYGAPTPALVRGRVVLDVDADGVAAPGETGMAGVSVSDGYQVVKTGPDGAYALPPSGSAVFINVTRPAGHDVSGPWYKPLAPAVDFTLRRAGRSEEEYIFVHLSDTHVSTVPACLEGVSRFVTEVNALEPKPRFVVNSGDLVNLDKRLEVPAATGHTYFRNYVGLMNHLSMPYYNVAGDHTDSSYRLEQFPRGDHRCGKALFWEYLGPHFFSFEYGRVHFVSVDFCYHLGEKKGYATHTVVPEHVEWLREDMRNRAPNSFTVTTSEHDLERFCPNFPDLAREYDIRLQLIGDDHIVFHKAQVVPYRVGGSLSGCWWNPRCNGLCPDLSPQGYTIYRVRGEDMECFYKGLGQRVAIVSPRYGAPLTGRARLQAHLVQPGPGDTLHYTVNGGEPHAMREVARPFLRAVFEADIDSTASPDGLLQLRVTNPADGEVRERTFVVKNGDGELPDATAASLSFTVGNVQAARQAPSGDVEVLLNGKAIGTLRRGQRTTYVLPVPPTALSSVNTLRFNFAEAGDGMGITDPVLTVDGQRYQDPRSAAVEKVRVAHWSEKAATWGGFAVGEGLCARPFVRVQQTFCFVCGPGM